MKKILLILLALTLTLTMLAACNTGKNSDEDNTTDASTSAIKTFSYKGNAITVNSDSKDIVEKLGEPKATEVFDAGCGDSTPGYIYSYNGFEIITNPMDGVNLVDKIKISSDLVSTPEGATIGMDKSDITKIYGEPYAKSDEILRYVSGSTMLQFDLNGAGKVIAITYKPAN